MWNIILDYCKKHECLIYEIEIDGSPLGKAKQISGNCQLDEFCSSCFKDQPKVEVYLGSAYRKIMNIEEKQ